MTRGDDGSPQSRFEGTTAGRIVISLFLGITLVCVLVTLMSGSAPIQKRLIGTTQPYLNALGLDQNWGVFAPDPRQSVIGLQGRVVYRDGQTAVWTPPEANRLIGAPWDYRWPKYVEFMNSPDFTVGRRPLAALIARDMRRDGKQPVQVTLVTRTRPITPPGIRERPQPFQENAIFTYTVPQGGTSG